VLQAPGLPALSPTAAVELDGATAAPPAVAAEIPAEAAFLRAPAQSPPALPSRRSRSATHRMPARSPDGFSSHSVPPDTGPALGHWRRCVLLPQQSVARTSRPPSALLARPQGDGCSQQSSCGSNSSSRSSSHELDSSGSIPDIGGVSAVHLDSNSHEEIATEEPLAQWPLRDWLRNGHVSGFGTPFAREASAVSEEPMAAPLRHTEGRIAGFARRAAHHNPVEGRSLQNSDLASSWQVADELGHSGGMAAPRYLLVRLGECIPAETGAAPVHLSRLDTGPQWRDFLNYGEGKEPVPLDEILSCPICLAIFAHPVGLPCGHSLCRSCYRALVSQPQECRRCPLCRVDLPQCDVKANLALAAVCDSFRNFKAAGEPRSSSLFLERPE